MTCVRSKHIILPYSFLLQRVCLGEQWPFCSQHFCLKTSSLTSLTDQSTPETCLSSTVCSRILSITQAKHMQVGIPSILEIQLGQQKSAFCFKNNQHYGSQLHSYMWSTVPNKEQRYFPLELFSLLSALGCQSSLYHVADQGLGLLQISRGLQNLVIIPLCFSSTSTQ